MNEDEIKKEIEDKVISTVNKDYSIWTIVITDVPHRRRVEHNNPIFWIQGEADNETIERNGKKHLLDKGMKGETDSSINLIYVYIL